ncbi:MAG: hypothetical protein Q4A16_02570 [Lautropia sp.]|nr:hypothetical protein [Lautropia sp.]
MSLESNRINPAKSIRLTPVAAVMLTALSLLAGPVQAALQQVTYTRHLDGTPGPSLLTGNNAAGGSFDATDGPGLDSGPTNDIVRTHDFFEYNVSLSADTAEKDVHIRITLPPSPLGATPIAEWAYMPPECRTGSTMSADKQSIDCLMTDFTASGTRSLFFRGVVLGHARNGDRIPAPALQVGSTTTPSITPASLPDPLTVSAAPFYDVKVERLAQNTTGVMSGSGPDGQTGFYHRFMVGLIARNPNGHGRKGVEQLDPGKPIDITVDISGYPSSVRLDDWRATTPTTATTAAIGGFEDGCGSPGSPRTMRPSSLSGGAISTYARVQDLGPTSSALTNTVGNGGDCTVLSHDRQHVTLRINGADTTLSHYPTMLTPSTVTLPLDEFWVLNKAVVLWTELNQTDYPENKTIWHPVSLSSVYGESVSGQILNTDHNPANDTTTHSLTNTTAGDASKSFIPDANTLPAPYATIRDATLISGNQVNQIAPAQSVGAQVYYTNTGTSPHQNIVLCEIIDRTAFDISDKLRVVTTGDSTGATIEYGAHAHGSPYFSSTDSAPSEYEGRPTSRDRSVVGDSAYAQARCDDPGINWFGTAHQAQAAGGLVYIRSSKKELAPNTNHGLQIYGLIQRSTWAATIAVQTPVAGVRTAGDTIPEGTIIRNRAHIISPTMPSLSEKANLRDHIRIISSQTVSRIDKTVIEPASANNDVPVSAGTTMTYRLAGRYSTTYPPAPGTVTITDVLPEGLRYVHNSAVIDGLPQEPQIENDTPAVGLTTLTWKFVDRVPHLGQTTDAGAALPLIEYKARASQSLNDDTVLRNQATISSSTDPDAPCTYDTTNGTGYGLCVKASAAEVTIQSPPGFFVEKSASQPSIEPGDPFEYTISFISMGRDLRTPDIPDIIDILPFVGDGPGNPDKHQAPRQPASQFDSGAYRLRAVVLPAMDPNARVYYTKRPALEIHNDPQDDSNRLPGGSTRWCLTTELGSTGCPAHIGESTAIRVSPSISSVDANRLYEITLQMETDPVRSYAGNIFSNRAGIRPVDESSTLLYVETQANLYVQVESPVASLSGRVFADIDQNNVMDGRDWPLAEQCITLNGTTHKGQTITLSTRTDAQGRYDFAKDVADRIYPTTDCSTTPLPYFAGLIQGEYTLSRQPGTNAGQQSDGAVHAGSAGGTVGDHQISKITLAPSVAATDYHFTATPNLPRLTLLATVRNDHGGSAGPADATLKASLDRGGTDPVLNGAGDAAGLNQAAVPIGRYALDQSELPGYDTGHWSCSINGQAAVAGAELSLDYGDQAVCTIEYDDRPGRLSLRKILDLQHGRHARVEDFLLHAEGQDAGLPSFSGRTGEAAIEAVEVPAGRYLLREDNLPYFLAGAWVCRVLATDGGGDEAPMTDAIVTVGNGEDISCSITNTDAPLRVSLDLVTTDNGQSGHGGAGSGSGSDGGDDPALPPVILYITPVDDPTQQIPLNLGEAASSQLVPGDEYELSVSQTPGYQTKLLCHDGQNQLVPLRLTLGGQNISCRVERKRIPTTMSVTKELDGEIHPIDGTLNEYALAYIIRVTHTGGADGVYDLIDTPAFDPDVQIISYDSILNGQTMEISPNDGSWTLASQQPLAMGASDVYRMQFRVRVPFGSETQNDGCVPGAAGAGRGLFNQVSLTNRQDDGPGDTSGNSTHTAQACVPTPEPATKVALSIEKTSSTRSAEVGDLITYRLRVRNSGEGPALSPVIVDRLPRGFSFEPNSLRVQGARQISAQFSGQRELRLTLERIDPSGTAGSGGTDVVISYRVRLGVGSQEGDGTNRAHIECPVNIRNGGSTATASCSNEARWKVQVKSGVFSEEACLAGQIFVDCNGNSVKDPEELGIPGVRFYLQNGTWIVSDEQGKYSHCGLRPRTHVLKVDARTLPRRSRLVTSSAQNVGDAESLFIDARKGMLHRADFIEGSCSTVVVEQVKARQALGASTSVQTETGQPALHFESKRGPRARPLREGTDDARQSRPHSRH